jgi:hypothetical protein
VSKFAERWQQELENLPRDVRAEYEAVRLGEEVPGRLVERIGFLRRRIIWAGVLIILVVSASNPHYS